jgi:DUF4097 and DUF4098 domain-containing protein YvlB
MARFALASVTALVLAGVAGCGNGSINGPVSVAAGQKTGDISAVNGSVNIGDGATVQSAMTVNGPVTLGSDVTAQSVKTVNGEVKVGRGSKISGGVKTVNGAVILDSNVDVQGEIANINGAIRLTSAHVGGGIKTINADIDVGSGSRVEGGIHVEKPGISTDSDAHVPRIVIGPNATVNGGMTFERNVRLYVSDSAQIGGPIEGATPEKFSGDQPPN